MKITEIQLHQFLVDNVGKKVRITRAKACGGASIRTYTVEYWEHFDMYNLAHESGDNFFDMQERYISDILCWITFEIL